MNVLTARFHLNFPNSGIPVGGSLSVAPLPTKYGQFSGRGGQGQSEDHRVAQVEVSMGDCDDPYDRICSEGRTCGAETIPPWGETWPVPVKDV